MINADISGFSVVCKISNFSLLINLSKLILSGDFTFICFDVSIILNFKAANYEKQKKMNE
jgi:hypothetical protein